MEKVRILIVDDHAMFREGLRTVLEGQNDMAVVGECGDAESVPAAVIELRPDVVLMDLHLPGASGVSAMVNLLEVRPQTKVIALTMYKDEDVVAAAIQAGAQGYVLKDARAADLVSAIRTVMAGGAAIDPIVAAHVLAQYRRLARPDGAGAQNDFTPRERELLRLLADGGSNRDMAERLFLSEQTVKNALSGIYRKLGVNRRTEAIVVAIRRGLITQKP